MAENQQNKRSSGLAMSSSASAQPGGALGPSHREGEWEPSAERVRAQADKAQPEGHTYEGGAEQSEPAGAAETSQSEEEKKARQAQEEARRQAESIAQQQAEAASRPAGAAYQQGESVQSHEAESNGKLKEQFTKALTGIMSTPLIAGIGILKAVAQAIRRISDRFMGTTWESRARAAKETLADTRKEHAASFEEHEQRMKADQEQMAKMAYENEQTLSEMERRRRSAEAEQAAERSSVPPEGKREATHGPGAGSQAQGSSSNAEKPTHGNSAKDRLAGYIGGYSGAGDRQYNSTASDREKVFNAKFDYHMRSPFPKGSMIFANESDFWKKECWETEEVGYKNAMDLFEAPDKDYRGRLADTFSSGDREEIAAALFELASYQQSIGSKASVDDIGCQFATAWFMARSAAESLDDDALKAISNELAYGESAGTQHLARVLTNFSENFESYYEQVQHSPNLSELANGWYEQNKALAQRDSVHETAYSEPVNSQRNAQPDASSVAPENEAPANMDADAWTPPHAPDAPSAAPTDAAQPERPTSGVANRDGADNDEPQQWMGGTGTNGPSPA